MSTAAKLIFPGYSPSNYAPTSGNTDGHLQGIDNALGTTPGASGGVQTFALGGGNTVASTIWSGPPGEPIYCDCYPNRNFFSNYFCSLSYSRRRVRFSTVCDL